MCCPDRRPLSRRATFELSATGEERFCLDQRLGQQKALVLIKMIHIHA
ncbi:MAG: hypothetical protein ACREX8_18185 [Gammaproteobacteria bacterium]